MEKKSLNTNSNYNIDYNIHYSIHVAEKVQQRLLELDRIDLTVNQGKSLAKAKYPKLYKKLYFGKENETYFVIFTNNKTHIKVITAWKRKGN